MSVSLCVWHAMGAVLSWFTFHLSGFLLETVDIFKRCGVSNKSYHSQFYGTIIPAPAFAHSKCHTLVLILPFASSSF